MGPPRPRPRPGRGRPTIVACAGFESPRAGGASWPNSGSAGAAVTPSSNASATAATRSTVPACSPAPRPSIAGAASRAALAPTAQRHQRRHRGPPRSSVRRPQPRDRSGPCRRRDASVRVPASPPTFPGVGSRARRGRENLATVAGGDVLPDRRAARGRRGGAGRTRDLPARVRPAGHRARAGDLVSAASPVGGGRALRATAGSSDDPQLADDWRESQSARRLRS